MTEARQLKLGAALVGVGNDQLEWRYPEVPGDASVDIDWFIKHARLAEEAKFDFVFMVDSPFITPDTTPHFLNRLEPLTLLSALAVSTSKIGLIATLTTSYWEPYNAARLFASLDNISKGRAGWNVVTTGLEGAAGNYGREAHFDHADRYRRAHEFVEVVKGLWDSYEDDAFPANKETGVFLEKSKQHRLNHKGEFFSVTGPLALTRSKQGHPVLFQAGISEDGRNLAAHVADGTYAGVDNFDEAQDYYADLKGRAAALGRNPDHISIIPALRPIIEETDEAAWARVGDRREKLDLDKALVALGRPFGYHDFRQYDIDGPFPDVSHLSLNSYRGFAERILKRVREQNLTIRQIALSLTERRQNFVGSPKTIADEIEKWFEGRAADGFNVWVARTSEFLKFRDQVVPILRERGLFKTEYAHDTLRGHLGIPVPENRWTAQAAQALHAAE
jgi:FMN-dependent oxidoreductase (nitrilotriacetate monooxygenase family)